MIIKTNTWHYKAYDASYVVSTGFTPRHTNLCQYWRRVILVAPLVGMLSVFLLLMIGIMTFLYSVLGPLFGWIPTSFDVLKRGGMRKYQGLKLGKSYNAFQLYPWHALLASGVIGLHYVIYQQLGAAPLISEAKVVGVIVAFLAITLGLVIYFSSDTSRMIRKYLAAKKQKVCPVVEFESPKSQQEEQS